MSSAAGFNVGFIYINHPQIVARNDTPLIQPEPVLLLRLSFIHEKFVNLFPAQNNPIRLVFNVDFLLLCERLIMRDIQMRAFRGFFRTVLPHVWALKLHKFLYLKLSYTPQTQYESQCDGFSKFSSFSYLKTLRLPAQLRSCRQLACPIYATPISRLFPRSPPYTIHSQFSKVPRRVLAHLIIKKITLPEVG